MKKLHFLTQSTRLALVSACVLMFTGCGGGGGSGGVFEPHAGGQEGTIGTGRTLLVGGSSLDDQGKPVDIVVADLVGDNSVESNEDGSYELFAELDPFGNVRLQAVELETSSSTEELVLDIGSAEQADGPVSTLRVDYETTDAGIGVKEIGLNDLESVLNIDGGISSNTPAFESSEGGVSDLDVALNEAQEQKTATNKEEAPREPSANDLQNPFSADLVIENNEDSPNQSSGSLKEELGF